MIPGWRDRAASPRYNLFFSCQISSFKATGTRPKKGVLQQETAANAKPGEQGDGWPGEPPMWPRHSGGERPGPGVGSGGSGPAAPPSHPGGSGGNRDGRGEKGDDRAGEGDVGLANTPCSTGLWERGSSEPVTNVKSVLAEEGGGGGCSSVPECLFLRYLFISLSSGVLFELFSLSLDLSIISKIMKFPNVALSGCIPIPPSLFPILPAAPGTGVPGDVKTKTRRGGAGGGETGLCQPCQGQELPVGSGEGAQPFPPPGCLWTSPTSIRGPLCCWEPCCEDRRGGGVCRDLCLQQNSLHHKNCVNSIKLFMGGGVSE